MEQMLLIEPSNPDYFLKLDEIYVGAKSSNNIIEGHISEEDLLSFRKKCT